MADHAAESFLLEQVTNVIKGYADLISGAEKDFERLKEDAVELKAILEDTAYKSGEDYDFRLVRDQMREVVYEVEDAIDTCLTEANAKHRLKRGAPNFSIAKEVKSLREEKVRIMLVKAKEMKKALESVGASKEGEASERKMVKNPPIRQEKIVGLEDAEEMITWYLRKDQPELDIIPIIGMPGLGKTTLARKIYNDDKIRFDFPIRIWVQFSQKFNGRDVLIQIMKHFTANMEELYIKSNRELCNAVWSCLSQDKFLLVVDDVWRTEHWDDIKSALPYSNGNGKVIITSRELTVGIHVKNITDPYYQRPLNEYESWELLQLEVFGKLGVCPDALRGIGNAIAKKCEGLPLTIVVLGSILKDQFLSLKSDALVREKWIKVAQNPNLELEDKKQVIVDAVALSYDRLPDNLRNCFLYLGVFPADYEIQTWTLMSLWIAEGFVQPDGKRSLEKIAEDYLNDLISRNLLMVQKVNPMREVKACGVHDVIRMFCIAEAEKQNLFKCVRIQEDYSSAIKASDMEKIHRLCLQSDLDKFLSEVRKGPHVRSFLYFRKDAVELKPEHVSAIPKYFPSLRILQTKSIKFIEFPQRVTKLIHLRYIVLCIPDLKIIPEPLSQLWDLQTIIIDTDSDSLTMKASIWKMMRLRHVKTKAAIILEKEFVEGDQAGENLQTLNILAPESVKAVSQRAKCLKTLGVSGNLAPLFNDMPSENMKHLEKLKLYQAATSENRMQQLPDLNRFTPNLKRLTLSNTFLDWKHMSNLAMIPGLEVLKLKDNAFSGITWEAETYCFRKLQCLIILIADLVLWTASTSTFPCLRHLELKNCIDLNAIPDCVLHCLESLDIGRVPLSIVDTAKNLAVKLKLGADLL